MLFKITARKYSYIDIKAHIHLIDNNNNINHINSFNITHGFKRRG